MSERRQHRRTFLQGAGVTLAALAGCIADDSPGDDEIPTETETVTPEATESPTTSPTEPTTPTETVPDHSWFVPRGETLDSFDSFEDDWSVSAGVAEVVEDGFDGGQAVRMSNDGGHRTRIVRNFYEARDLTDQDFSIALNLHSSTKGFLEFRLVLEDVSGNRRYHTGTVEPKATDTWLRLDMAVAHDEGFDPSAVSELWIEHYAGNEETVFTVDDVRTVPKPDRGYLIFTFDDKGVDDYDVAYDVLSEYGYAGVCFPPIEFVHSDSTPSVYEYQEMVENGWEVGGHTLRHERLSDFSRDEQERILAENARQLDEKGLADGPLHFRTPFSDYDTSTLEVVMDHFDTCVSGAGTAFGTNFNLTDPRMIGFRSGDDLKSAKAAIDGAAEHRQLLGLTIHMGYIDREHLETLVEYVHGHVERGDLDVITLGDLHERNLKR